MERTTDQKMSNAPFEIQLGDATFKVKRLTINRAKEWRAKVIQHEQSLSTLFGETQGIERISAMSDAGPGLVVDLVLAYLENQTGDKVTREQIEEANDDQLSAVYEEFVRVTFPNGVDAGTKAVQRALTSQT